MINISIFWHFFILGLFSFGGPIAHIGYFRKKFVEELNWLSDEEFSKIVALSQFLPERPAHHKLVFDWIKRRWNYWCNISFDLHLQLLLFTFICWLQLFQNAYENSSVIYALMSGLKLFAVVVVADATF
ncbi:MAG: chromate transporter [Arcobacter sp.]|nr:chromate transporter [Arcobacter sp.]